MFRHDDIGIDVAAVPATDPFEFAFKDVAGFWGSEKLQTVIATEGDEVETALLLVTC